MAKIRKKDFQFLKCGDDEYEVVYTSPKKFTKHSCYLKSKDLVNVLCDYPLQKDLDILKKICKGKYK